MEIQIRLIILPLKEAWNWKYRNSRVISKNVRPNTKRTFNEQILIMDFQILINCSGNWHCGNAIFFLKQKGTNRILTKMLPLNLMFPLQSFGKSMLSYDYKYQTIVISNKISFEWINQAASHIRCVISDHHPQSLVNPKLTQSLQSLSLFRFILSNSLYLLNF